MWLELGRRIATIMLIVAVATGFAVPVTQAGSQHHGQFFIGISTSMNSLASCKHGTCLVGQNAESHANCSVSCTGVSGQVPIMAAFHFNGAQGAMMPSLNRTMVEQTIPPDPHPPKHI